MGPARRTARAADNPPVVPVSVVAVERRLLHSRHRLLGIDVRAILDLLSGEIQFDGVAVGVYGGDRPWGDQHTPPGEPGAAIHDEVPDDPLPVIEQEVIHPADLSVRPADGELLQFLDEAAQHGDSLL